MEHMKRSLTLPVILVFSAAFIVLSCGTPLTITTWKNPSLSNQVTKVAVMPMFEQLKYLKPFETSIVQVFNEKGLKAIGSLGFLNPEKKYEINDIKRKCDSLGADAMLVFIYEGVDKTESYVAPTTYYTGYYGGYGGYYGGGYWGGYYATPTMTTGGYWETSSTFKLKADLYVKGSKDPLWTGYIQVTDPTHIDQTGYMVGSTIYSDWKKEKLIKNQ